MAKADLRGADFSATNMAGADLSGADLTGANFADADLTGALQKDCKQSLQSVSCRLMLISLLNSGQIGRSQFAECDFRSRGLGKGDHEKS